MVLQKGRSFLKSHLEQVSFEQKSLSCWTADSASHLVQKLRGKILVFAEVEN
jgi:hypothetical protein